MSASVAVLDNHNEVSCFSDNIKPLGETEKRASQIAEPIIKRGFSLNKVIKNLKYSYKFIVFKRKVRNAFLGTLMILTAGVLALTTLVGFGYVGLILSKALFCFLDRILFVIPLLLMAIITWILFHFLQ